MILATALITRYGKVLAILAAVVIAALAITSKINSALERAQERGRAEVRAGMAVQVAKANAATAAAEQRQRDQSQRAAQAWESKRNELQSQFDGLLARGVSVRLCKPAAGAAPVPGAGPATAVPDDSAGRAVDSLSPGRNIGTELVQLGAECERYREQVISLQAWIVETR